MFRRLPKRALVLLAAAALFPWAGVTTGAQAGHLGPQPLGIMQDGDGRGNSAPLQTEGGGGPLDNFFMRSTLFHGNRFPLPNGQTQRPGFRKYAAWGTVTAGQDAMPPVMEGDHQLALTTSDDGVSWTAPRLATIEDPETGEDVPFIIGNISNLRQFAVAFLPAAPMPTDNLQFVIYYSRIDPDDPTDIANIENIRRAISADGVTWVDHPCDDPTACHITQDGTFELIENDPCPDAPRNPECAPHKLGTLGPTDIEFNPSGSTAATCGTSPVFNPWNCRWVMIYDTGSSPDAPSPGLLESSGIGWSGNGTNWFGSQVPLIERGVPGAWDERYATMTHVTPLSNHDFIAYYSGGRAPETGPFACYDGLVPCLSLGTAYSSDGINFIKTGENPVTPNVLTGPFLPNPPHSLFHAQALGDAGAGFKKVFYTALDNGTLPIASPPPADPSVDFDADESMMLGRQAFFPPAPGLRIRIDNPLPGATPSAEVTLTAYVADDSGVNIGVDPTSITAEFKNLDTLVVTPITGLVRQQSLIGAMRRTGFKVTRANVWTLVPDGRYELSITAKDLDGNSLTETVSFIIDHSAPNTVVTAEPTTPAVVLPGGSIAIVEGISTDTTSPLLGVRAVVTNPLLMKKSYEVNFLAGQPSNPPMGFSNMTLSSDGKSLSWRWIAPGLDVHTILPGPYTISFIAFDSNRNTENVDSVNTVEVFVV